MQKHIIYDTSFWVVWCAKPCFFLPLGAQKCKINCMIRYSQALLFFILGFFKQAVTKVFKVIMQLSFQR